MAVINGVLDTLVAPHFLIGVATGCAMLGIGLISAFLRPSPEPTPYGGLLVTGGILAAFALTGSVSLGMVAGIALLGLAGQVHRSIMLGFVFATPGAVVIVAAITNDFASWIPWFAMIAIVMTAPLVASFDSLYGRTGLSLPLFAVSALSLYLTVPDTELAIVFFGTAAVVGFLGWPKPVMSFGAAGAFSAVGLYVAAASIGAIGRPASLIAAVACLGLLIVVPVARHIVHSGKSLCCLDRIEPAIAIIGQLVLTLLISRTVGRLDTPWLTALLSAAILTGALLTLAFLRTAEGPHRLTEHNGVQRS